MRDPPSVVPGKGAPNGLSRCRVHRGPIALAEGVEMVR